MTYHTIEEVAKICRASRRAVLEWIAVGRLRSTKLGRRRLVRSDWLDAALETRARGGDDAE